MQNGACREKCQEKLCACIKLCVPVLCAAVLLLACGATSGETDAEQISGRDAEDETEVQEETVDITLPAAFLAGEDDTEVTQEMVDNGLGDSEGVVKGILNEDGTVTYTITVSKQKELKEELAESIETHIQELVENPSYGFESVDHNEDYTEFTVRLEGTTLSSLVESSVLIFYTAGRYYSLYDGHEPDDIVVNFISPTTDEVSVSYHYRDFIGGQAD